MKCVICGRVIKGHGNNPEPVKHHGKCCDWCNTHMVIPARMKDIDDYFRNLEEQE